MRIECGSYNRALPKMHLFVFQLFPAGYSWDRWAAAYAPWFRWGASSHFLSFDFSFKQNRVFVCVYKNPCNHGGKDMLKSIQVDLDWFCIRIYWLGFGGLPLQMAGFSVKQETLHPAYTLDFCLVCPCSPFRPMGCEKSMHFGVKGCLNMFASNKSLSEKHIPCANPWRISSWQLVDIHIYIYIVLHEQYNKPRVSKQILTFYAWVFLW